LPLAYYSPNKVFNDHVLELLLNFTADKTAYCLCFHCCYYIGDKNNNLPKMRQKNKRREIKQIFGEDANDIFDIEKSGKI
jgi:hypothetical protein